MAEPNLVADIGGTNARFALVEQEGANVSLLDVEYFRATDFPTVHDAASAYLDKVGIQPRQACFAVAGPVAQNDLGETEVVFSNSHWHLKQKDVVNALSLERFLLINDFYALAAGIPFLCDEAFKDIKAGTSEATAPQLVIGPGTGLGQALIVPTENGNKIISTEGGHVSFAALTDEDFQIRKIIARKYGRLSQERMLSGHGLENIYDAQCELRGQEISSLRADEITAAALEGDNEAAVRTLHMFCETLGSTAGDAVLSSGARGGVVLGGGILPKILPFFLESAFLEYFHDKGRMRHYVKDTPIKLIISEGTALYGATSALSED